MPTTDSAHQPAAIDPRLPLVGDMMQALREQMSSVTATMGFLEDVIRDVAAKGVSAEEIAASTRLTTDSIARVLAGGPILEWPHQGATA